MENKQDLIIELERIHKLSTSLYNEEEKLGSLDERFENKIQQCAKRYYTELGKFKKEYETSHSVKIPEMFCLSPAAKKLIKKLPMDILHYPEAKSASSYIWYYVANTKYKKEIYTGIVAYACGFLALFSLVTALLFNIKLIMLSCALGFAWLCLKHIVAPENLEDYWTHHEEVKEFESLFNECVKNEEKDRFYKEFQEYDKYFTDLKKACDEQLLKVKPLYLKEREKLEAEHRVIRQECEKSVKEIGEALESVTIINDEMFEKADKIADMLKKGRADTLKEAINLVLDEERKDAEENMRRAEAYLLATQNKLHNEAMQKLRKSKLQRHEHITKQWLKMQENNLNLNVNKEKKIYKRRETDAFLVLTIQNVPENYARIL